MFDLSSLMKYLLEGSAVAVAAYLIPQKKADLREILLIALTAAAVFAVLDQFSPLVGAGARQGAGFGIGLPMVGFGVGGLEGFDYDENAMQYGQGLDDYEGFQTNGSSTDVENPDHATACKLSGDRCSYSPDATAQQRAHYVCQKEGDNCKPHRACQSTDAGVCEWNANAGFKVNENTDVSGRACQTDTIAGKQICHLVSTTAPTATPASSSMTSTTNSSGSDSNGGTGMEGFSSQISAFEGFSKKF